MKKILATVTVLLLSLVLAGCESLPIDDLKQTREEICKDDPTNALCDIVDLIEFEGIEETVLVDKLLLMINDLEDTTKSNEDVCTLWFDGKDDDCDGLVDDVRTKFKAGASLSKKVNIIDDNKDDSELKAEISFDFNGHVTVLKISLDIDNENNRIKVKNSETELVFIPDTVIENQLETYVLALRNDDLVVNVCHFLTTKDGIGGVDNDCNMRMSFNDPIKYQFILKTINPSGDNTENPEYEAILESDFNGHVTVLKITFTEDDSMASKAINVIDVVGEFIPNPTIEAELGQLVKDLANEDLNEEEVCGMWATKEGIGGLDNDCDLRSSLNVPIKHKFIVKTIKPSGDDTENPDYEAVFENDFNGHVTVLKITFTEDDSMGTLKIKVNSLVEEFTPREEIASQLDSFIEDLANQDISSEEVCRVWATKDGIGGVDNDCNLRLSLNDPIKYKFTIKTIKPSGDDTDNPEFEAVLFYEEDGHVTVLKITFIEDDSMEPIKISVKKVELELPEEEFLNGEETIAAFNIFLDDYLNPEITFDQLNDLYFDGNLNSNYRIGRDTRVGDYASITLHTTGNPTPDADGYFELEVNYNNGEDTEIVSLKVKFIRKKFDNIKNKMMILEDEDNIRVANLFDDGVDQDCDGVCVVNTEETAFVLYQKYIDAYLNPTMTREMLGSYFEDTPTDSYFDQRDKLLLAEDKIMLVDLVGAFEDGSFLVVYDIVNGENSTRYHEKILIKKRIDKATPLLAIVDPNDDGDSIDTEAKMDLLSNYQNALNTPAGEGENACTNYIRGNGNTCCPSCKPIKCDTGTQMIDSIELLEMNGLEFIRVTYESANESDETIDLISTCLVFFYLDADENILMELFSVDYDSYGRMK